MGRAHRKYICYWNMGTETDRTDHARQAHMPPIILTCYGHHTRFTTSSALGLIRRRLWTGILSSEFFPFIPFKLRASPSAHPRGASFSAYFALALAEPLHFNIRMRYFHAHLSAG